MDRLLYFHSLTINPDAPTATGGPCYASCARVPFSHYFSSMKKLEKFMKQKNLTGGIATHEITLKVLKDLLKQSKRKPRCEECGK